MGGSKRTLAFDRLTLTVKEFGRKVVIAIVRGKMECSKDGKKMTITYTDSPVRGPRK